MSDQNCHAVKALESRYLSPKEAALDNAFRKILLKRTQVNSSLYEKDFNCDYSSGFSDHTLNNLSKLLSTDYRFLTKSDNQNDYRQTELGSAPTANEITDIIIQGIMERIKSSSDSILDDLSCPYCLELLYNPVTFICGHSACKNCVVDATHCKICNASLTNVSSLSVNVLLSSMLQKIFPMKYIGKNLITEGDVLMRNNWVQEAISKYTEAVQFIPTSHVACHKRAKAHLACKNIELAIEDSERVGILSKKWPKTYSFKAEILQLLGKHEEALLNVIVCAAIDPSDTSSVLKAQKIVTKLTSSISDHNTELRTSTKRELNENYAKDIVCKKRSKLTNSNSLLVSEQLPCHSDVVESSSAKQPKGSFPKCSPLEIKTTASTERTASDRKKAVSSSTNSDSRMMTEATQSKVKLPERLMNIIRELESNIVDDFGSLYITPPNEGTFKDCISSSSQSADEPLIEASDLECSLCMRLYFEPACTPCGHLFCKRCLERCLDHSVQCPLCKSCLKQPHKDEILFHPAIDISVQTIIKRYLPYEHEHRVKQYEDEVHHQKKTMPIFVCTVAFPSVPCPLHIYEPRYRLMLRRVLDIHEKEFGMSVQTGDNSFHKIGTILKVKKVSFLQDGRSVVQSVGSKRFEVSERSSCDGYDTARIQYIVDEPVQNEQELETLKKLLNIVYSKCSEWHTNLQDHYKNQIKQHFGKFPPFDDSLGDNGPDWTWWILAVVPVEDKIKLSILGKRLLRERLLIIHRIITCLLRKQVKQES